MRPQHIFIQQTGAPNVMQLTDFELLAPARDEIQMRQTAIGFNFIDTYQRKGLYPIALPSGLGHEAAGVIEKIGSDVKDLKVGDRVAYMNAGIGAYTTHRNVKADKVVKLPPEISDAQAATLLLKGLTAQFLLHKTYVVKAGDKILVHAAAGGVGQILCRWAKALGAFVIGTTSSEKKMAVAKEAGCDIVIDYSKEDWPQALLKATHGEKVQVAYDSVGKDTLIKTFDCVAPFGLVVLYGSASGAAPLIDTNLLNDKGCLYLTRPIVFAHNATVETLRANAAALFKAVAQGFVRPEIGHEFLLKDVAKAHEQAEARLTTGTILLVP